jgi:hypothetical protein
MPVGTESIRAGGGCGAHLVTSGDTPFGYAVSLGAAKLVKHRPPGAASATRGCNGDTANRPPSPRGNTALCAAAGRVTIVGSRLGWPAGLLSFGRAGGREQDVFAVWRVFFVFFSKSGTACGVVSDRPHRSEMSADTPCRLKVEGFPCASPRGGPERTRPGLTTDVAAPRNRSR